MHFQTKNTLKNHHGDNLKHYLNVFSNEKLFEKYFITETNKNPNHDSDLRVLCHSSTVRIRIQKELESIVNGWIYIYMIWSKRNCTAWNDAMDYIIELYMLEMTSDVTIKLLKMPSLLRCFLCSRQKWKVLTFSLFRFGYFCHGACAIYILPLISIPPGHALMSFRYAVHSNGSSIPSFQGLIIFVVWPALHVLFSL